MNKRLNLFQRWGSLAETNGTAVQNLIFDIWLINCDFCSVTIIMSKQNEIWFASAMMIFYSSLAFLPQGSRRARRGLKITFCLCDEQLCENTEKILNKTYLTFCMRHGVFSFQAFFSPFSLFKAGKN